MLNTTELLIDAFLVELRKGYRRMYGGLKTSYEDIICWAGCMALENIANSDALYHNTEHTILVTLVGQEIFRGRHVRDGGLTPEEWLLAIISLLCHDIGYVRGVCRRDRPDQNLFCTGIGDEMVKPPEGSSDAILSPYHVNRSQMFVRERFSGHPLIDAETICKNIEWTHFPVPKEHDDTDTRSTPALVRASDLIGQMADPRYLRKTTALFYEFEETGTNKVLGYTTPNDLRKHYPRFYWQSTHKYIKDALRYLSLSPCGRQITANLFSHLFVTEHDMGDIADCCFNSPCIEG